MFRDLLEVFGIMFVVLFVILFFVLGGADIHGRYSCGKYGEVSGVETKWVFLSQCYVNHPSLGWTPYEQITAAKTAEIGLGAMSDK